MYFENGRNSVKRSFRLPDILILKVNEFMHNLLVVTGKRRYSLEIFSNRSKYFEISNSNLKIQE